MTYLMKASTHINETSPAAWLQPFRAEVAATKVVEAEVAKAKAEVAVAKVAKFHLEMATEAFVINLEMRTAVVLETTVDTRTRCSTDGQAAPMAASVTKEWMLANKE